MERTKEAANREIKISFSNDNHSVYLPGGDSKQSLAQHQ